MKRVRLVVDCLLKRLKAGVAGVGDACVGSSASHTGGPVQCWDQPGSGWRGEGSVCSR